MGVFDGLGLSVRNDVASRWCVPVVATAAQNLGEIPVPKSRGVFVPSALLRFKPYAANGFWLRAVKEVALDGFFNI